MKRILIAVTAMLALGAGGAVAMDDDAMAEKMSLSFSGKGHFGVLYRGEEKDGNTVKSKSSIDFVHYARFEFAGAGVTDTGLTFGADARINASSDKNVVDHADVFIGGDMWTFTVGTPDRASDLAFSLGDVGGEINLGVDDVAEGIGKATGDPQARLDLTFGVATVAVSVGQKDGKDYKAGSPAMPAMWSYNLSWTNGETGDDKKEGNLAWKPTHPIDRFRGARQKDANTALESLVSTPVTIGTPQVSTAFEGDEPRAIFVTPGTGNTGLHTFADMEGSGEHKFYRIGRDIYQVVGTPDQWAVDGGNENGNITPGTEDDKRVSRVGVDVKTNTKDTEDILVATLPEDAFGDDGNPIDGLVITADKGSYTDLKEKVAEQLATEQDTLWSLGAKFDIGPATLGFGFDSEKAMLVSVGGNFGSVGGSIFYGQRDIMVKKVEHKASGLGAEVTFEAGEGTTVNVVATQYEVDGMKSMDMDGFGAGVKHDLGGGAKVEAGFAQVDDVNKASVGVTMSF